jgi:hypothetical protein
MSQMNGEFVNEYGSDVSAQRAAMVCEYQILSVIKSIKVRSMVTIAKIKSEILALIAYEVKLIGHLVTGVSVQMKILKFCNRG